MKPMTVMMMFRADVHGYDDAASDNDLPAI